MVELITELINGIFLGVSNRQKLGKTIIIKQLYSLEANIDKSIQPESIVAKDMKLKINPWIKDNGKQATCLYYLQHTITVSGK